MLAVTLALLIAQQTPAPASAQPNAGHAALTGQRASTPGWETWADPSSGFEVLKPAGWFVEALANDVVSVRPPPPLGGFVTLIPVSGPSLTAGPLVLEIASRLGAQFDKSMPVAGGEAALVRYSEGVPPVPRVALIAAALENGRGVVAVLSAPETEWAAARPALAAIAQSFHVTAPPPKIATEAVRPLEFEPLREPKQQAFTLDLPRDWENDLSVDVVPGQLPYVRASAIGRSPDHLYAFAHYKLASFQVPVPNLTPSHPGFRYYEAGAWALERYLFPSVVKKSPEQFGDWKITRKGGVQVLFYHPSNVRFDGEEVEYTYRFKGELLRGRAYVVTYHLPGTPSPTWYLYGLYGYEAPPGREAQAQEAALKLLETFTWEGRYAAQSDMFFKLARDSALKVLTVKPAQPGALTTRREPYTRLEQATLSLTQAAPAGGPAVPVTVGIAPLFAGSEAEVPRVRGLDAVK